jgi:hypothetical protein
LASGRKKESSSAEILRESAVAEKGRTLITGFGWGGLGLEMGFSPGETGRIVADGAMRPLTDTPLAPMGRSRETLLIAGDRAAERKHS